jgi:tRNA C32,U32 (ribose-2'-O)-methylase TrmJ
VTPIIFNLNSLIKKSTFPKKRAKNLVNSTLTSTLDRANINNRNVTFVLAAVAQSIGQDITNIALNRGSIR